MDVIQKIENLRSQRGWTIYKLSIESGISQSTLATMYERKTPPKIDTLQCICEAFNLTLAQFFLEDEQIEVLSEQEKSLLVSFRKLSPKRQKALIDLL